MYRIFVRVAFSTIPFTGKNCYITCWIIMSPESEMGVNQQEPKKLDERFFARDRNTSFTPRKHEVSS